jgi:hypothetical protein
MMSFPVAAEYRIAFTPKSPTAAATMEVTGVLQSRGVGGYAGKAMRTPGTPVPASSALTVRGPERDSNMMLRAAREVVREGSLHTSRHRATYLLFSFFTTFRRTPPAASVACPQRETSIVGVNHLQYRGREETNSFQSL